jgi:hypothetical protein
MSNTIKLLIIFFFSLKLSNLTITYIFQRIPFIIKIKILKYKTQHLKF